jgi:hypothetical protein
MARVETPARARSFTYAGVTVDGATGTVVATYRLDDVEFTETASFEGLDLSAPGVDAAADLYAMLAGLSYYKAGAAHTVDLGELRVGPAARALLAAALDGGLGEFAYRNGLDLRGVAVEGGAGQRQRVAVERGRGPLIPFGGGIDSIVTTAITRGDDAALFIVGPRDDRFEAIERPAAITGLPIVRCARSLDPLIFESAQRGWFNGHVPVTAMVSALAVVAAVAQGRSEVVMSNERSASSPNLLAGGRAVNHQWSKSLQFEDLLRAALLEALDGGPDYFSALRDRSELWVARELARRPEYLGAFMSCNRAFRQDPAARATTWCGECDKCLFIDLVMAPFCDRTTLEDIFSGREPIADPARTHDLEVLVGIADNPKPFECVGDVHECATALVAAAARPDRADQPHLAGLARRCEAAPLEALLAPSGPTNAPVTGAARDRV